MMGPMIGVQRRVWRKARKWLLPVIVLLPVACATVDAPAPGSVAVPPGAGESPLLSRDRLCALAEGERLQRLASLASAADPRQQLQRLMLASCDPWHHQEALQQALLAVSERQDWSADEAAYLRLMRSQQAALARQREETVRGISEIEDVIEQRPASESQIPETRP